MDNTPRDTAARQLIESYGPIARAILQERAEIAREHGHDRSADIWRELARAVARRLDEVGGDA